MEVGDTRPAFAMTATGRAKVDRALLDRVPRTSAGLCLLAGDKQHDGDSDVGEENKDTSGWPVAASSLSSTLGTGKRASWAIKK